MLPARAYARFARRMLQHWTGRRLPFWTSWFINSECQIRCGGCFFFSRDFPRGEPLSSAQRFDLLEQLIALQQPYLTLLGGEPFQCPDLFPLARRAMAGGITVDVTTNGLDLDEADIERVDGSFYQIWISIDGPREAHDLGRGPGTWDRAMFTLRELLKRKQRTKIGVSTVLGRRNAGGMVEFLRELRALGVDQVCFKDNLMPELRAEAGEFRAALDGVLRLKRETPGFIRQEEEFLRALPERREDGYEACLLDSHLHVALLPDGTVSACVSFPVPIGNVREQPLAEILRPGPSGRYEAGGSCPGCTRNDVLLFKHFLDSPWSVLAPGQAAKLLHT